MKRDSIRSHLRAYSIYARRITTVNHAFASAIAINDDYDDKLMTQALLDLGQDPDAELMCAYCGISRAETWDHVFGLVVGKQYSGFGHTLGNLLPCCRDCNSQKGNRDWKTFLRSKTLDENTYRVKVDKFERYFAAYGRKRFGNQILKSSALRRCRAMLQFRARLLD